MAYPQAQPPVVAGAQLRVNVAQAVVAGVAAAELEFGLARQPRSSSSCTTRMSLRRDLEEARECGDRRSARQVHERLRRKQPDAVRRCRSKRARDEAVVGALGRELKLSGRARVRRATRTPALWRVDFVFRVRGCRDRRTARIMCSLIIDSCAQAHGRARAKKRPALQRAVPMGRIGNRRSARVCGRADRKPAIPNYFFSSSLSASFSASFSRLVRRLPQHVPRRRSRRSFRLLPRATGVDQRIHDRDDHRVFVAVQQRACTPLGQRNRAQMDRVALLELRQVHLDMLGQIGRQTGDFELGHDVVDQTLRELDRGRSVFTGVVERHLDVDFFLRGLTRWKSTCSTSCLNGCICTSRSSTWFMPCPQVPYRGSTSGTLPS